MHIWFGGKPYGGNVGRYYGFNILDRFSFHVRIGGIGNELGLQLGNRLWFLS
jgi:hypothetical protein